MISFKKWFKNLFEEKSKEEAVPKTLIPEEIYFNKVREALRIFEEIDRLEELVEKVNRHKHYDILAASLVLAEIRRRQDDWKKQLIKIFGE